MQIISWNVNGLRALHRKDNWKWLLQESPDAFCLQEIKALAEQLPDEVKNPKGYYSYFNAPNEKKGYSGTALYTKEEPTQVSYGFGIDALTDEEGRIITAYFKDWVLITCYFPNGGGGAERLAYKLDFYDKFLAYIEELKKEYHVVFCGDVNTAHEEIDLARPKANETNTGFLPEERAWLDEVVNHGWIDTFRFLNPNKKEVYSYWDMKTRARDRNVGWRIDYFFISGELQKNLKETKYHTDVFGSDHCPLSLEVNL
jgi:exodeoxyribonuclease-3